MHDRTYCTATPGRAHVQYAKLCATLARGPAPLVYKLCSQVFGNASFHSQQASSNGAPQGAMHFDLVLGNPYCTQITADNGRRPMRRPYEGGREIKSPGGAPHQYLMARAGH